MPSGYRLCFRVYRFHFHFHERNGAVQQNQISQLNIFRFKNANPVFLIHTKNQSGIGRFTFNSNIFLIMESKMALLIINPVNLIEKITPFGQE